MQLGNGKRNKALKSAIEVAAIADNLNICINKLKRVRQRLMSGQLVQTTALLLIRHFIYRTDNCQNLSLCMFEKILAGEEFCQLSDAAQQSVHVCSRFVRHIL